MQNREPDMTVISITPWLAALVGILSAGFATAYPSLDQYSERNHYRIARHHGLGSLQPASQGGAAPVQVAWADDAASDKQIPDKWPLGHGELSWSKPRRAQSLTRLALCMCVYCTASFAWRPSVAYSLRDSIVFLRIMAC